MATVSSGIRSFDPATGSAGSVSVAADFGAGVEVRSLALEGPHVILTGTRDDESVLEIYDRSGSLLWEAAPGVLSDIRVEATFGDDGLLYALGDETVFVFGTGL